VLRGKHKATYTPNVDMGDFVIVLNAGGVRLTGSKPDKKLYRHHTLFPGGIMYTSVSGIWQPVWLEPVPSTSSIAGIKLVPDIDNARLAVTANVSGSTGGITVSAVARIGTNVVGTISGDDTIFIATADPRAQQRLLARLREHFGA